MKRIQSFFLATRFILVALLFVGLSFVLSAENILEKYKLTRSILSHLGFAMMIASIVGIVIEFTEIKKFIEERFIEILKGDDFLDVMKEDRLKDYNLKIMQKIGQNKVLNPIYDYWSLPQLITDEVLLYFGETYYDHTHETIEYSNVTNEDLQRRGIDDTNIQPPNNIFKITYSTRSRIISPKIAEETSFKIPFFWYVKKIPNLEKEKHLELTLEIDGVKQSLNLDGAITDDSDKITIDMEHDIKFTGSTSFLLNATLFEYGRTGSLPVYFESPTHNLTVHFSSDTPLDLFAQITGLTVNSYEPSITKYSVSINYEGWLLPGHGYSISWEKT